MKKLAVILALGAAALIAGGCAVPLGENFAVARETTRNGIYIIDYNLQTYVLVPVTGEQPIKFVTARGDLEASVTWIKDNTEIADLQTFAADTEYSAKIELSPRAGYLFNPSIAFAYYPGKIISQNDDKATPVRTVLVTYNNSDYGKLTRVTNYDLQKYVPAPVAGQIPKKTFAINGVTGTVIWEGASLDAEGKFMAGAVYTAKISLTPFSKDYFFDPSKSFAYADGKVTTQTDNKLIPTRTVQTAYKEALLQVTLRDLTNYIETPVVSGQPNKANFTNAQYAGSFGNWSPDETFVKGTYAAAVTLTAETGYTFDGLGKNSFRHDNSSNVLFTVGNTGTTGTVVVTFSLNSSGSGSGPVNVTTTWGGGGK
ncbi:MAG: hypothetical protein LBL19_07585 [Spirochaetaceae bacterium]|jgi:hypothetical protein|nr:hypothetical protein [Spirochaetaceae bacterium]